MPLIFTRRAEQAFSADFKAQILRVYGFFPELQGKEISCGLIVKRGRVEGVATGWTVPPIFRLRPNVSNYTIAHELTHLVQGNGSGVPHGEVACDIWTVGRLPAELLDKRPYYLKCTGIDWKKDRAAVKDLCEQAIELRKTQRAYIVWLKCQLKSLNSANSLKTSQAQSGL